MQKKYMQRCLDIAAKGLGHVAPNPMVGCVIVHENEIIGEGFHEQYNESHAEVNAINSVENKYILEKASLYVNLEPCSHQGKTPPCVDLIIRYKIPSVTIGSIDSNQLVKGKGIKALVESGCNVKVGLMEKESKILNKRFFIFHEKRRPYIILKWAQTKDKFIDIKRNEDNLNKPLQISNNESRKLLHKWRSEEQSIMIGTNTALLDNPMLTVREWKGKNPLRVILDKWLRIPSHYYILDKSVPTIIFTSHNHKKKSQKNLEYININFEGNVVEQILNELYKREIQSIIIEGGETLLNSFIEKNIWDEARIFTSETKIGKGIKAPVLGVGGGSEDNVAGDRLEIYNNT